jgi:hypothetical protein
MSVVFSLGATAETMATWKDSEYFSSGLAPFFLIMTAAEDLLEIVMRRYERAGTLLTSNRPVDDDWGKLLGDSAAVTPLPPCSMPPSSWPRTQMRSTELAH